MKIAVTTPTGHIGSRVLERLLESDAEVVVLARHPEKLPARERVRVAQGTLEDAAFVAAATAGADALFALVPPNYVAEDFAAWQRGVGRSIAEAVRQNGIARVVLLSSAGAHRKDLGPISWLGEIEDLLEAAAPNVTSLRAGFFMENLLGSIGTIRAAGTLYSSAPAQMPVSFVATRDLGDAAARLLLDPSWTGHRVQPIYGPADVSFGDAARILGEALGQAVQYVAAPREATRQALLQMGASPNVAETYAAMFDDLARLGFPREPRDQALIGETSLEEWVREVFVPAYGATVPA